MTQRILGVGQLLCKILSSLSKASGGTSRYKDADLCMQSSAWVKISLSLPTLSEGVYPCKSLDELLTIDYTAYCVLTLSERSWVTNSETNTQPNKHTAEITIMLKLASMHPCMAA